MKSVTTFRFRKLMQKLPAEIQMQANDAYDLWKDNPSHPSLRFKIHSSLPIYSVRISLSYRAIGKMEGETIIWFWIGSHNDYDQLINQLK